MGLIEFGGNPLCALRGDFMGEAWWPDIFAAYRHCSRAFWRMAGDILYFNRIFNRLADPGQILLPWHMGIRRMLLYPASVLPHRILTKLDLHPQAGSAAEGGQQLEGEEVHMSLHLQRIETPPNREQ